MGDLMTNPPGGKGGGGFKVGQYGQILKSCIDGKTQFSIHPNFLEMLFKTHNTIYPIHGSFPHRAVLKQVDLLALETMIT